jgi:hypothetical protein
MRKLVYQLLPFILLSVCISSYSQVTSNGKFDARLIVQSIDCQNKKLFLDIEVKASTTDSTFVIGDQNYKFNYNADAISNPAVNQELGFSLLSTGQFYSGHNTNGSEVSGDTGLTVLNVVWINGLPGSLLSSSWTPVSRLAFDIVDTSLTECLRLSWRDKANNTTHFTNITEVEVGNLTTATVNENVYASNTACLDTLCGPNTSFPVEWVSFDVERDGQDALLEWVVAAEYNNDFFEVERSVDGIRFEPIGRVRGKGNSTTKSTYSFVDPQVDQYARPVIYYKLRQVDTDGTFSYSNTVELTLTDPRAISLNVFPNPTNQFAFVDYCVESKGKSRLELLDLTGKTVQILPLSETKGRVFLDVRNLSEGIYVVKITNEGGFQTAKLVVQ